MPFPATAWPNPTPTTARVHIEAVCCPLCQSINVRKAVQRARSMLATWQCHDCNHHWRELREVGGLRAAVP